MKLSKMESIHMVMQILQIHPMPSQDALDSTHS